MFPWKKIIQKVPQETASFAKNLEIHEVTHGISTHLDHYQGTGGQSLELMKKENEIPSIRRHINIKSLNSLLIIRNTGNIWNIFFCYFSKNLSRENPIL